VGKLFAGIVALVVLVGAVVGGVLIWGGDHASLGSPLEPTSPSRSALTPAVPSPADDPAYDVAVSKPVEDSYYPAHGDPGVDTLHYGLDLTWKPATKTLTGTATIALRAARDADRLRLDLLDALKVSLVVLDGEATKWVQRHDQLQVLAAMKAGERHVLEVTYAGTPAPVPAPTTRTDFTQTGMEITRDGEIWTMQEPFGAYTWYPVNDQPADKALYDFTIRAPHDWVGVANGELLSRRVADGRTVTRWHLAQPAASYLTTIAVGDFVQTKDKSPSGVPLSYWTHRGDARALAALRVTPKIMAWNERHLGPYPFESLGLVIVDSDSGMETQSMITLGDTDYTRSPEVIEHEMTHQWYGDFVTPTDWRDLWMNEGMAMFVQGAYQADVGGRSIDGVMDEWAPYEQLTRRQSGPPGAYDKGEFGESNVYYGPALMWNELRHRLGDKAFWSMVRAWPRAHADGNATRRQYFDWLEKRTGLELTSFFNDWLMGRRTPDRHSG